MERITISIDASLAEAFDNLVSKIDYQNRSKAIRDLVRRSLEGRRLETAPSP